MTDGQCLLSLRIGQVLAKFGQARSASVAGTWKSHQHFSCMCSGNFATFGASVLKPARRRATFERCSSRSSPPPPPSQSVAFGQSSRLWENVMRRPIARPCAATSKRESPTPPAANARRSCMTSGHPPRAGQSGSGLRALDVGVVGGGAVGGAAEASVGRVGLLDAEPALSVDTLGARVSGGTAPRAASAQNSGAESPAESRRSRPGVRRCSATPAPALAKETIGSCLRPRASGANECE